MNPQLLFNVVAIVSGFASSCLPAVLAQTQLSEWDRGVAVGSKEQPDMHVYLWFYEWHMFGAMRPGQHTNGTWNNRVTVREIHYNHALRKAINAQAGDGKFAWSSKWPASEVDAIDGLIIRESTDGTWVTGIAWNRFLSAQGHNPWECMHLSAHVGPLEPRQTRTVTGRIWLFRGNRNDLLSRYRQWKPQQE